MKTIKTNKRNLCITAVLCLLFIMLSSTLILPIRAATENESSKGINLNVEKLSDTTFTIPMANGTVLVENLPSNCFKATYMSNDGKNTTFEIVNQKITNETVKQLNPNYNTAITQRVLLVNGEEAFKFPIMNHVFYWWGSGRVVCG
jgi:hypothetical protein